MPSFGFKTKCRYCPRNIGLKHFYNIFSCLDYMFDLLLAIFRFLYDEQLPKPPNVKPPCAYCYLANTCKLFFSNVALPHLYFMHVPLYADSWYTRTLADSETNLHWSTITSVYAHYMQCRRRLLYNIVYLYIYSDARAGYYSRMTPCAWSLAINVYRGRKEAAALQVINTVSAFSLINKKLQKSKQ